MLAVCSLRARKNSSKTFDASSGDIPMPSSFTDTVTYVPCTADAHPDAAARARILDRVLHEVGVGSSSGRPDRRERARPPRGRASPPRRGARLLFPLGFDDLGDDLRHGHGRAFQGEVARLDRREADQLVDRPRSVLTRSSARSSMCRSAAGSAFSMPLSTRFSQPSVAASGLFTSWATRETNIDFAVSSFFSSVTSLKTATAPEVSPPGSMIGLDIHHVREGPEGNLPGEDHESARRVRARH